MINTPTAHICFINATHLSNVHGKCDQKRTAALTNEIWKQRFENESNKLDILMAFLLPTEVIYIFKSQGKRTRKLEIILLISCSVLCTSG